MPGFGATCIFNAFTQRNNIMNYYKTESLPLIAFEWILLWFSLLPKQKRSNILRTIEFGSMFPLNFLILMVKAFERCHFRQNPKLTFRIVWEVNTSPLFSLTATLITTMQTDSLVNSRQWDLHDRSSGVVFLNANTSLQYFSISACLCQSGIGFLLG